MNKTRPISCLRGYILLAAFFCITLINCNTDIDKQFVKPASEVVASELKSVGFTDIVIDESNINLYPLVLTWTKSDFGQDVLVAYSIEMATDASFAHSHVVTIGNNVYSKALGCSDLNKWVINHFNGLDENDLPVKVTLLMRISATIALVNPTVTIPPEKVFSNTVSLSVIPYVSTASLPLP